MIDKLILFNISLARMPQQLSYVRSSSNWLDQTKSSNFDLLLVAT